MNDRFKFRLWNKAVKNFIYFNDSELSIDKENMGLLFRSDHLYMGNYEELQQCTGLKDKNGKLIYEGDFLKDDENLLYEVIFKLQEYATSFSLKRREIPDYYPHITTWCGLGYRNCNKYEVVGNIYENEELLDDGRG